jgi:hypothetical protein
MSQFQAAGPIDRLILDPDECLASPGNRMHLLIILYQVSILCEHDAEGNWSAVRIWVAGPAIHRVCE